MTTVVRIALRTVLSATTAATLSLLLSASALAAPRIEDCHTIMSQRSYEATGARLVLLKPADLMHFPPGFFCKTCLGGGGFENIVFEDGSVANTGWEHMALFDHAKSLFSNDALWRSEVVSERITAMRYEPPRVGGKPVCVRVNFNWMIAKPTELRRWDDAP